MIRSLEGARGAAALTVALFHLKIGADYVPFIRHGYLFVDLFFVLSGFVIYSAYGDRMKTWSDFRSFFVRRVGRLWPLLIFATIVYVAVANGIVVAKQLAVAHGYGGALRNAGELAYDVPTPFEAAAVITMTHGMGLFDHLVLNGPTWSISTEFYTYLLFALACVALSGTRRVAVFTVLIVAGFAVAVLADVRVNACGERGGCLGVTYDFGFARTVGSFFLGAMVFRLSRRIRFRRELLQFPSLLAIAAMFALLDTVPHAAFAAPLLYAVLILSLSTDEGRLGAALTAATFQRLGERSYSIYLMHAPLVLVFENVATRTTNVGIRLGILLVFLVLLYAVAGLTYRLIEQPFKRLAYRLAATA